jgi:hypothetical protein
VKPIVLNYFSEKPLGMDEWEAEIEAQTEASGLLPQLPSRS